MDGAKTLTKVTMIDTSNAELVYPKKSMAYKAVKRFLDIFLSLIALVCLSPVLLITSIAIYLEDRGSIIYKQERIGKGEKIFHIYKFRSMKIGAERIHEELRKQYGDDAVSFKIKNDPRITKVGKLIRKFNIDELPQLINILKGEISIVGPRPLPVYEYQEERNRYGKRYTARYGVPQGLTCFWQISNRADVAFEDRMQMDVDYANHCDTMTDVSLIIKTALAVVTGKAEY